MSITPSKYIKENRKKSTFNFKQSLTDRVGADTFNTDIEQFNKDYSADYLSNWHSAEDINTYYDRLSSLNDRTKAYQSYVNLYGTDEQKSVLGDIGKQISAYDEMIGKKQDVLDYYGTFKDAEAYSNALAYETEKAAKAKAEQDRIASLNVDLVKTSIANIDTSIANYEQKYRSAIAKPATTPQEQQSRASLMNSYQEMLDDLKATKSSLEADIAAKELYDRNKMYTDILGSSEFASFVPVEDNNYDAVEKGKNPAAAISNVGHTTTGSGMSTADMASFQSYGSARYGEMEDEEYKLYKYLQEMYGQEVAGQYAFDLDNELISRYQESFKTFADEHPRLGTIASFGTSALQGVDFLTGVAEKAITGNVRQGELTAATSALREGAVSDNPVDKFIYNTVASGVDSAIAAYVGNVVGGVFGAVKTAGTVASKVASGVGSTMLGLSAASSTSNDILARGGTADQAITGGIAAGFFEGFFESFSVSQLQSMQPKEIVKNFKVYVSNVRKSVATNASEEFATEVANIIFDSAYMGELSNVSMMLDQYRSQGLPEEEAKRKVAHNLGVQVLEAAASGALIGGGMTAIGGGVGLAKVDKARRKLGKSNISGGKTATLIEEATEAFKGEEYKKQQALIQKVEKGLADNKQGRSQQRNIGKLIEAYVEANYKEQNRELAEDSVNNIEKTKKTIENEATKTKVDNTNPTITNDNLPKILGFKEGKLSETVIETENGATAFTEESAANADIGTLYACAIRLGNTQSANNFVQNWDGITDPFQYYLDFLKFQMRGTYAPDSYDKTMTDYAGVKMSPAAKHAAFQSGISLRESTKEKIAKQSEELKGEYEKLGGKAKKGKFNDSKLNYSALTKEQKDVVNFTRILSDYLGVNVEFFVSQKGKRGANGYYKAKNNTIYLDIYAGIGNKESYSAIKDCLINTMSHEVVHNMKVTAPTEYAALRDFIIDKLSKQEGYDLDAKIEQIIAENSDQGFTVEDAIEEIVAMSCEDLLGSSEKLQTTLTEFYAQNEKAANSFTKYVREVLNRLKAFFEKIIGKKSIAEESQLMAKQSAEFISELQKRYDAALLAMREGNAVRNTKNATESEKVMRQLRKVNPVQPSSDKWQRTHTTEEVKAQFPNLWDVSADESEVRNPTQISGTVKSYRKIYDFLKKSGFNGTILDASSGLGYGTRAGIDEYGFDVEDIEPYPDKSYSPKYTDYSTLDKKYDVIISNAVLNVIPQDQRDALVVKMGELLNEGGRLFVNVRGDDVKNASSKEAINEDLMEYYISKSGSYQKGFTKPELVAYLEDALGDEYTVMPITFFGKTSAVVTKSGTSFAQKFIDKTLDSFGITRPKDFVHVQRQVLTTLLNEGFFTNVEERSRTDINEASGMVIETNKSGIDETFDINNFRRVGMTKKIAKLATIRMLPKIIKDGKLVTDNVNYQYGYSKNVRFAYITHDVEIDGKRITLRLDIKKSPQKNKFWVHHVELIENVSDSPASTDKGTEAGQAITDIKPIVSQSTDSVNPSDEKTFEQKRTETTTNRELLANALESTIDTSTEEGKVQLERLKDYKASVKRIATLEKQRADLVEKGMELMRKKGRNKEETAELTSIWEKTKSLEKRISLHDKELLRLEALKPIQTLLEREKTKAVKKAKKQGTEKQKEIRENYAQREYIKKIEDRAKGLNDALTKAGKKHVPEPFKEVIAEVITAIDFSSKRKLEGKGETKKDVSLFEAFSNFANLLNGEHTEDIKDFLIACDITDEFAKEFLEIKKNIDDIAKAVGTSDSLILRQMTSEQLRQLNSALYKLSRQISEANKLMENKLFKNSRDMSIEFMRFANKFATKEDVKWLEKLLDVDNLTPYYAFKRMGKVGMSLFNEWADGWDTYSKLSKDIIQFTKDLYTSDEVNKWTNEVHEFDINGDKYYLTTAHLMSFYLLHKQKDSRQHIEGYGIVVETFKTDPSIKSKQIKGKTYTNNSKGTYITQEVALQLLTELDKDKRAKEVADKLQNFMATDCADWANYITMRRFGEKAYTIEDYFPIESSKNEMNTEQSTPNLMSLYALLNKSFTKARVPKANNKIMIRDVFDVFTTHTTEVAAYRSFGLPLLDMLKFYNFRQTHIDIDGNKISNSVKASIVDAFGEPFKNYLETFIRDVTGTTRSEDRTSEFTSRLISRYKIAAVAGNVRVIALQGTAYFRASAVLKHRYLLKEVKDTPQLRRAMKTMQEYSGIALWKNDNDLGFRDVNITNSLADKIKHKDTITDKITEGALKGAALADNVTWASIWLACENEIKDTQKQLTAGSTEFYEAVALRFREVIYATQVVDSPLAKSQVMRSKSAWDKIKTSFMAEPTTSYNLLVDAYHEIADTKRRGEKVSQGNYLRVAKLVVTYVEGAVAQAVIESLIDAMRKVADDEDEELIGAYWEEVWQNTIKELSVFRKLPILKSISEAVESNFFGGYAQNQNMDVAVIDRALQGIKEVVKFINGESSITKLIKKIFNAISSLTGIPISNTYREIKTLWNNAVNMFNGGDGRIE